MISTRVRSRVSWMRHSISSRVAIAWNSWRSCASSTLSRSTPQNVMRSEEHTSELQSPDHLVCRLLLEKKKKTLLKERHCKLDVREYDVAQAISPTLSHF